MDAAERAELGELRRRAFGPTPDIDADEVSLARLIELEELALHAHEQPAAPAPAVPEAEPAVADASRSPEPPAEAASTPSATLSPAPSPPPGRRRARGLLVATGGLVVGITAATVVGGWIAAPGDGGPEGTPTALAEASPPPYEGREQFSFARDSDAVEVLRVPLGGYFGQSIDMPADEYVPDFPTSGVVDWASPLGEYYGWDLWIAGAEGMIQGEHCLLIEQGSERRARCVPAALRPHAALIVAVPFADIMPEERPTELDDGERLGFWWGEDDAIVVLVGDDPAL